MLIKIKLSRPQVVVIVSALILTALTTIIGACRITSNNVQISGYDTIRCELVNLESPAETSPDLPASHQTFCAETPWAIAETGTATPMPDPTADWRRDYDD